MKANEIKKANSLYRQKGNEAENAAVVYLRQRGYLVLARNIRFFGVEIDILARKTLQNENNYYFYEVKCVKEKNFLAGYPAISRRQCLRYQQAALIWQQNLGKTLPIQTGLLVLDQKQNVLGFLEHFSPDLQLKHSC